MAFAATWHVPDDFSTIQLAIDSASPGDDVLVAPGTYYEHDIRLKGGVWVHSAAGAEQTIVDARDIGRGFDCIDQEQPVTLEGFLIRNGATIGENYYGAGVRCVGSDLYIRNCWITACNAGEGGGVFATGLEGRACRLWIYESKISNCAAYKFAGLLTHGLTGFTMDRTEVVGNEAQSVGGMYCWSAVSTVSRCSIIGNSAYMWDYFSAAATFQNGVIDVRDTIIAWNYGSEPESDALSLWFCTGVVSGCTLANNRGGGGGPCAIYSIMSDVLFERTIVAFNDGPATLCAGGTLQWTCSDAFGNWSDDLCGTDLGGNFSADPLFCRPQTGDYSLDRNSPCLPGNHPEGADCGLIGALAQGCGLQGACCLDDGTCVLLDQGDCEEQNGAYQGDGTACEPDPCQPTAVERTTWGRVRASFR